jgi:hypothetical protein
VPGSNATFGNSIGSTRIGPQELIAAQIAKLETTNDARHHQKIVSYKAYLCNTRQDELLGGFGSSQTI